MTENVSPLFPVKNTEVRFKSVRYYRKGISHISYYDSKTLNGIVNHYSKRLTSLYQITLLTGRGESMLQVRHASFPSLTSSKPSEVKFIVGGTAERCFG